MLDTGYWFAVDCTFTGETVDEVIRQAQEFVGCDADAIERNACAEHGRVDFAVTESADGTPLTARELDMWKEGKLRAWYAVYSGTVEQVQRVSA